MGGPGGQMLREVGEQPAAVEDTLGALLPLRGRIWEVARDRRRVLLAARGSSDNAAIYARYLLEVHAGVNASLAAPSVATHYGARLDLSDAVMVAISQSGATREIVEVQEWARSCGARTIGVTNEADSPLATGADLALVTRAGAELAVPATKTYLTQLVAMAVLGTALSPEPTALDGDLARVPAEIARLVGPTEATGRAVELLRDAAGPTVVSGRGLLLGSALEVALKMEETCLRPVRGYSYADLRHGPISVVEEGIVVVLLAAASGPLTAGMTELAADLHRRGARIVGVGGDAAFAAEVDVALPGPELPELLAPLGIVVPAQLVIHRLALANGLDPDQPRGLAKVTQTDRHPS